MRFRALVILTLILTVASTAANARSRKHKKHSSGGDSLAVTLLKKQFIEIEALRRELGEFKKLLRPQQVTSLIPEEALVPEPPRNPVVVAPMPMPETRTLSGYEQHIAKSAKVKDLVPRLADKVASILAACEGSRITSGYRRGARVRGSGKASLHSKYPSRAADLAGNPSCIRSKLAGWPGGLSIDYARVRHYHVSYDPGSREWGARFAHYSKRKHARTKRHHVNAG